MCIFSVTIGNIYFNETITCFHFLLHPAFDEAWHLPAKIHEHRSASFLGHSRGLMGTRPLACQWLTYLGSRRSLRSHPVQGRACKHRSMEHGGRRPWGSRRGHLHLKTVTGGTRPQEPGWARPWCLQQWQCYHCQGHKAKTCMANTRLCSVQWPPPQPGLLQPMHPKGANKAIQQPVQEGRPW